MASKLAKATHDKDLSSVISRLHSGSRFITYTDTTRGSKPSSEDITHNVLRNLSSPDEVHAELGRALASSYVDSLHCMSPLLMKVEVQAAIDRGDNIIQNLVCGEQVSDDKREAYHENYNRANYASAASSFFDNLAKLLFNEDEDAMPKEEALRSFVAVQWQKWCVRCEELGFAKETAFSGGGGYYVLNACLKGYASICFVNISIGSGDSSSTFNGSGAVYQSLKQSASRKFWVRICVAHAAETLSKEPTKLLVECLSTEAVEIVKSKASGPDKLLVDALSPLFYACVLKSSNGSQQEPEVLQNKQSERQLLLQEILRGCSVLLRGVKDEDDSVLNQVACMVQYLSTSLQSYLGQIATAGASANDIMEFAYDWLRGIVDIMQLVMAKSGGKSPPAIDALNTSCGIILRHLLPKITSKHASSTSALFDMASVYSSLWKTVTSLPRCKLVQMADPKLALNMGVLALSLHNDEEVNLLCRLISSVFASLDEDGANETSTRGAYKPSNITTAGRATGIPTSSDIRWIGGILCTLANMFNPRPSVIAFDLKLLGEKLLRSAMTRSQSGEGKANKGTAQEECHLIDVLSQSYDDKSNGGAEFQFLMSIMTSSIANVDEEPPLLYDWKHRPLSLSEQNAALLIGLSHLHILFMSANSEGPDDPFTFLHSLLTCHPRLSARAVPSLVDLASTCVIRAATLQLLLKAIKFLSSSAVVSDPHGASLSWTFLSSLTADSVPPVVRSTVLRVLPDMCASNKKLRSRIRAIVGKSLASSDPVIRTAAMASLSDLAKLDLLRDVEEIVGWIQAALKDEEVAVTYFALLSLKYLVANDELDFDLVMRVLEKRLCIDLDDMSNIVSVFGYGLILEGFVMLLAEAGLEEEDEEEEDEQGDNYEGPQVSVQSVQAVSMLVNLALSPELSLRNPANKVLDHSDSRVRIHMNILKSLSSFNPQLLGLDAETIRSWNAEETSDEIIAVKQRYEDIKNITLMGLDFVTDIPEFDAGITNVVQESVVSMLKTLLSFEEHTHGSSLYKGSVATADDAARKGKGDSQPRMSKAALMSLPDSEMILKIYEDEPNASTATAVMCSNFYCSLSIEETLSCLSDLFTDFASERLSEPYLQAVQISSLMDCMGNLRQSINNEQEQQEVFRSVTEEIENWVNTVGEYAYVALALFVIDIEGGTDSPEIADEATRIQSKILGDLDIMFDSEEIKLLCLCLVGSKLSRTADSRVTEIIDCIEKYFSGRIDGQVPFGVIFGMSLLVKHLLQDGNLNRSDPSDEWRRRQAWRLVSLYVSTLNACFTVLNPTVSSLASSFDGDETAPGLEESCVQLEELFVKDGSLQTIRSLMIGLGRCCSSIAAMDADLAACLLGVIEKLPWKSGKAFALPAVYKSCLTLGVREQNDLSNEISAISSLVNDSTDDPFLGHIIYAISNLSQLRSRAERTEPETDLVKNTFQAIMDPGRDVSGDRKQMAILSALSLVGEVRGLSVSSSGLHEYTKKDFVKSTAEFLKVVAGNGAEDSKTRDAATIALGLMSGMKVSGNKVKKSRNKSSNDRTVNFNEILQGKEDTLLLSILVRISSSHETVTSMAFGDTTRAAASQKLSLMFKAFEAIALPGSVSRVIEVTLNDSCKDETELKTSCISLLASQLESRRRVGFDGRGFIDLYTRISKMPPEAMHKVVGTKNVPTLVASVSNLIPQLPTSSGEEMLTNLWTSCRYDLSQLLSTASAIEFFIGLKSILIAAESSSKKNVVSPAMLRCIQKLVVSTFFEDMCRTCPSARNYELTSEVEKLWIACAGCIKEVTDSSPISECEVNNANVFGMSACAIILKHSSKVSRKVEMFISRHEWLDTDLDSETKVLASLIMLGTRNPTMNEMKESILSLFDLMLVKGINTLSLEVIAVKVAFWCESLQMNQIDSLESPVLEVPTQSSLLFTRNLCFKMQAWPLDLMIEFFEWCTADLPPKLAILCQMWKISDEVCNKASRVLGACCEHAETGNTLSDTRRKKSLVCLKQIVQLLNGGEP